MRIISQNGAIDVPYEKCCIWLDENSKCVKLSPIGEPDSNYVFGLYSTEEKAQKAMEMLREKYAHMKRVECFSSLFASNHLDTLSNKEVKMLGDETQKLMCFQFPQDEDVEV